MSFGKARYEVKCANGANLVNRLVANGYQLTKVVVGKDKVTFCADIKQKTKISDLISQYGYEYSIVGYTGYRDILHKAMMVLPYTIMVGIMSVLTIVATSYVYNVSVTTVDGAECYEIEKLLADNGLDGVLPKSKIDKSAIEDMILSNMPEISFATCSIEGVSLKVKVVKEQVSTPPTDKASLVATEDAIVTRVVVRDGTAMVKAGERVSKGQELIGGFHIKDNTPTDGTETGDIVQCVADGEVYGTVYTHKRIVLPEHALYLERTGESKVEREVWLGGWHIGGTPEPPYKHYQCTTTVNKISNILPFTFVTHTYYEYREVLLEREAYIQKIVYDTQSEVMDNMPIGAKLVSVDKEIKQVDGQDVLDIYIQVEQRIDDGGRTY